MARSEESRLREEERRRTSQRLRERREFRKKVAEERAAYKAEWARRIAVYREELRQQRAERKRQWWANMTPEQREAECAKIREALKRPPRVRPGPKKGEDHSRAKLTEEAVRKIHADMRVAQDVAADYGVSVTIIRLIWNGKIWKHLGLPKLERVDRRKRRVVEQAEEKPRLPPSLTEEQKLAIIASPFEDTKALAERLGVHWMFVATFRQKRLKKGFR